MPFDKALLRLLPFFFIVISASKSGAQSSDSTLDIVNWNIEWFGSPQYGPANDDLQQQNVTAILQYLNADLYALCEVVDTTRLRNVTNSLGGNYDFVISDYCSFAGNPKDPDWIGGQKLAFIYNKNIFTNINLRGMLRNSGEAYSNFASGRVPYLFNANVNVNGDKRNISFISLHGKAGTSSEDYNRRAGGASELKDTLDANFTTASFILLGDFNDDLDATISWQVATALSSYDAIIKDSTDDNRYISITLPLSYAGYTSTIFSNDILDHQVISNEMDSMYILNSAAIRTDIINVVPDFGTNNTSDHYPVFSQFHIINGDTSVVEIITPPPPVSDTIAGLIVMPNPFDNQIIIKSGQQLTNVSISLYNDLGKKVFSDYKTGIQINEPVTETISSNSKGVYFLKIECNQLHKTLKIMKK